jgi:pilus assembly protein Flp/PilA
MTNLISVIQAWMTARENDDRGATMVEYGLLVTLIALAAIAGLILLGGSLDAMFTNIANMI